MLSRRGSRICSVLVIAALGAFLVLTTLAAVAYPGGTFCDPDAPSYRFWGNFFCDLTQPFTQRGVDNTLSRLLAKASFFCFSLALAPFFWLLGELAPRGARLTRTLGALAALATNVVAWLPSGVSPVLHQTTVFLATIPGSIAVLVGLAGLVDRSRKSDAAPGLRISAALGCAALIVGSLDAAAYAYAIAQVHLAGVSSECRPWLPVLQKLAAFLLVAWIGSIAARRREDAAASSSRASERAEGA